MRLRTKIVIVTFLFFFTVIFALYMFINIHGTPILQDKLSKALGREIKVGVVRAAPLLNLRIKDIEIPGLGKIKRVYARGGAIDILRKDFILSELRLEGLELTIEKVKDKITPEKPVSLALPTEPEDTHVAVASHEKTHTPPTDDKTFPMHLIINRLRINDATINFIDKATRAEGIPISVTELDVAIDNLVFPVISSSITSFNIRGTIPWQKADAPKEGEIYANGWINLFKRDMQAKIDIKDIDAISLYPYYDKWVDLEGARIQKAKLWFTSDIAGRDGEVTADCHLELTDIVFRPKEDDEKEEKAHRIATAVLNLFQEFGGRVSVDFKIKTRMDKPYFDFNPILNAVEDKIHQASVAKGEQPSIQAALTLPVRLLEGGVKSATDLSRALIEGAFAVGKEVKDGVQGIIQDKDEKEEQKNDKQSTQATAAEQ